MEVVETKPMAWQPSMDSSSGTTVLHPTITEVRLCLRSTCGHTKLPPSSQWAYPLCPPCLEATRLKEANAKTTSASPNQSRRDSTVVTTPIQPSPASRPMPPPPPPNVIVVPCHFCPTRVAVPPGQSPNAPLLCKPCFERAIRDKQKQTSSGPSHPSGMAHRPGPRPPPLPRQVSLSNQANIRIAHSLSPVTPTFAKRPSMAIPQHPIPSSRIIPYMTPPSASPRIQHTNSDGTILLPATPPFLPVATPSPASMPAASSTGHNDDSDSDDLQLLYPESDDESMTGDADASVKNVDTPVTSSTPAIPELWTDELSELSSLSDPDSGGDDSDSEEEPLMISIKRRRISSSGLKIRIRIPSGFKFGQDSKPQVPAGAPPRACGVTSCKRTVEASSRWKLCTVCRSKYRKYQRKRIGVVNPRADLEEEEEPPKLHTQDAQINTAEAAVHAALSKEESRKCSNPWCTRRIPFENEYEFKQCIKCRVRGRWNVKKRRIISKHYDRGKEHVGISTHVITEYNRLQARRRKLGLVDEALPPEQQVVNTSITKAYPIFQNLKDTLLAMRLYTEDFLRAHTLYIRTMLDRGAEDRATMPCGFAFDGQFSIVANWSIRSHKTERLVTEIWQSIESDLKLKLAAPIVPWIEAGALVTRLFCEQPFSLPIPPSDPGLLAEGAILSAEADIGSNPRTSSIGETPDAKVLVAHKDSSPPSEPLPAALSLAPATSAGDIHTSSGTSLVTSPAGKPTGDLTVSPKLDAPSSVDAVENLPDVEMTKGDLSSLKLVPRSPEAMSSKTEAPADTNVDPRPLPPASTAAVYTGSVTHSSERAVEPAGSTDLAAVASTPEASRLPNGDTPTLLIDDFDMGDAEPEDDDSPSSSRAASPSLREDGPLLPDGVIMDRHMLVEVEVRVSEDKSNRFIPGHRIIVRFRLVV